MAQFVTTVDIKLTLNAAEFRLVSKALRNQLAKEDIPLAKALIDDLQVQRAKYIKHLSHENDKLIKSLEEAGLEV